MSIKYLPYVKPVDLDGLSLQKYKVIESAYSQADGEYIYMLNNIIPWIPQSCLRTECEMFEAKPNQEINNLYKKIDEAIENNDQELFNELSKKYALLKADFV